MPSDYVRVSIQFVLAALRLEESRGLLFVFHLFLDFTYYFLSGLKEDKDSKEAQTSLSVFVQVFLGFVHAHCLSIHHPFTF
jgi:hypothetical protein